jgi:hypothetical protein
MTRGGVIVAAQQAAMTLRSGGISIVQPFSLLPLGWEPNGPALWQGQS